MKKIIYILLLLFSVNISRSKDNFNLKPILLDFHGIDAKGDMIIAYGSCGSYMISYDDAVTWETGKIFEKGTIFKIFIEETKLVAMTKDGQIAESYDNAKTWNKVTKIDISSLEEDDGYNLTSGKKIGNKYFIRKNNFIYCMDESYNLIQQLDLPLGTNAFKEKFLTIPRNPIEFHNNKLYIPYGEFNIAILDANSLETINEINLKEVLNFNCSKCYFLNTFIIDGNDFYIQLNYSFYKLDENFITYDSIKPKSFWGGDLVGVKNGNIILKYGHSMKYYKYNKNQLNDTITDFIEYTPEHVIKMSIDANNITTKQPDGMRNFIFHNNKLIEVSEDNSVKIAYLDSTNLNVIDYKLVSAKSESELHNFDIIEFPKKSNNLIAYTLADYDISLGLSNLKLNDNIFEPLVDNYFKDKQNTNKLIVRNSSTHFRLFDFDSDNNSVIFGNNFNYEGDNLYLSLDGCKTFDSIARLTHIFGFYNRRNTKLIKKINENIIITWIQAPLGFYTDYFIFDQKFNYINRKNFKDQEHLLFNFKDTLNIDCLSLNTIDNTIDYKYTIDGGQNWQYMEMYPKGIRNLDIKELEISDKKYKFFSYYNVVEKKYYIDIIDMNKRERINIFNKVLTQSQSDSLDFIAFTASKGKFYVSFYNTLIVISNIFEQTPKWETFNYPNNGKVNKKFQIFDKTIFARYEDDKNEDNVYWINGIDMVGDPTSVENNIEEVSYLYTMPPYPNPTVSEVTAKFYWDSRIDIDNSEIGVFDITGNKVSGRENLTLEKLNEWSGNIKWNCVGQPKGTYLIKIQHGNNTKTVKVVVN